MIPFVQARNFGPTLPDRPVDLIVVHTMEAVEKPTTAAAVAAWFAGPQAPQASAHFCVDSSGIVQCVALSAVAWAAPGANRNGVHLEHAGFARQTPEEWRDPYSLTVLQVSAGLAALLCRRYKIPPVKVTPGPGSRGLCGHIDVTNTLCGGKGHTDPGPCFPWDDYLAMVEVAIDLLNDGAEADEIRG